MATRRASKPGQDASKEKRRASSPSRRALWVDEVVTGVTRMPSRPAKSGVPRLARGTNRDISKAPLGPREAFLLSRIDGTATAEELSDMTSMPLEEVNAILERMKRLGLVLL
jgi:hypothetical protein